MKFYFSLFLFSFTLLLSQSKLTVYDSEDQKPIKGAKIFCDKKLLSETDENGIAYFSTKCPKVEVAAKGFVSDDVIADKTMEIALDRTGKTHEIETVIITDKSDPRALAILDKVSRNFEKNAPKSLDSYSYKSYEKISFDLDEDSIRSYSGFIEKRKDSLTRIPNRTFSQKEKEKKEKD